MSNDKLTPKELEEKVVEYFAAPEGYFWNWEENGSVIAWQQGSNDTICYREELMPLLAEVSQRGLPRLGAILLVLSACREPWRKPGPRHRVLQLIFQRIGDQNPEAVSPQMQRALADVSTFLVMLGWLPPALRTGPAKAQLLLTLFAEDGTKIDTAGSAQYLSLFNSGSMDLRVFHGTTTFTASHIYYDIISLHKIFKRFPNRDSLIIQLRTGLEDIPEAPVPDLPEADNSDLLTELSRAPQTAGLANLAKHIIAALNIPMHTQGSSDQSFGGVSDITNRGNFDRLLLSELAQDDHTLLARLANNEALYLRREELPDDTQHHRVILVDTTLRMWGLPKVFAMASAVACVLHNKSGAPVFAYTLGGETFREEDLSSRNGIIAALEQLQPQLGCENGIIAYQRSVPAHQQAEYFLITDEATISGQRFQSLLGEMKTPPDYIITVNRNGQLRYYKLHNGHRKLLSEAKFDLQQLLTNKVKFTEQDLIPSGHIPAFIRQRNMPLFLPSTNLKSSFAPVPGELVAITFNRRVMHWKTSERGGTELYPTIEEGYYFYGAVGREIYLLITGRKDGAPVLYTFYPDEVRSKRMELPGSVNPSAAAVFANGMFYVYAERQGYKIKTDGTVAPSDWTQVRIQREITDNHNRAGINSRAKKIINNGYTTFFKIGQVRVHKMGIELDQKLLELGSDHIKFTQFKFFTYDTQKTMAVQTPKPGKLVGEQKIPEYYPQLRFSCFHWADGSEIIIDPRGLVHLRSSDKYLPEITIVMISARTTACWASDGATTGPVYFTGPPAKHTQNARQFYHNYIQRFIDVIM